MYKSKHKLAISNQLLFCDINQSLLTNRISYINKEARKKSSYNNVKVDCLYSLLKKARISFRNKSDY